MENTLFTVGPVQMHEDILALGGEQLPYFRTASFSAITLFCEKTIRRLANAPDGSRALFLTSSGTGAMEAAIINLLTTKDSALIVNGGSFGQRFCDICADDGIPFHALTPEPGTSPAPSGYTEDKLRDYSALLVNAHETSTGQLFDIETMGSNCRKAGCLFIVDAISSFLCDPIDMDAMGIDALIVSSQKALALPPGLSILILSRRAIERVMKNSVNSHYFGLRKYLKDAERGQTPFTPAVGILLQLERRLRRIEELGVRRLIDSSAESANRFRSMVAALPVKMFPDKPSNALSALSPTNGADAYDVFTTLAEKYGLYVTPNGGDLRRKVFRVGHMGNLTEDDYRALVKALSEVLR